MRGHILRAAASIVQTAGSYSAAVLSDSPLGYWKLDESSGTAANDSSGNAITGTYEGGFTLGAAAPPKIGGACVSLDGTSGYVNLGSPAALGLSAWTLEALIYAAVDNGNGRGIICESFGSDSQVTYALSLGGQGSSGVANDLRAGFYNGGWDSASSASVVLNTWQHVVATFDGSTTITLYVNGSQVATATASNSPISGMTGLYLGRRWDTNGSPYFSGRLSNCAIYGSALSPSRILAHANLGV